MLNTNLVSRAIREMSPEQIRRSIALHELRAVRDVASARCIGPWIRSIAYRASPRRNWRNWPAEAF
jgi:hypothetical protein